MNGPLQHLTPRALATAAAITAAWLGMAMAPEAKKIEIKTQHDKTVSFAGLKTWAWHPSGVGDVKLALTPDSDPARVRDRAEPVIVAAVEKEMAARGFTKAAGKPDVYVMYWLLGTIGQSSQYMGQFVGLPEWGLLPFPASTTAVRAYPVGTLLLDVFAANGKDLIWRGAAQAEIDLERSPAERKQRLESAIRSLLQKFPPKK